MPGARPPRRWCARFEVLAPSSGLNVPRPPIRFPSSPPPPCRAASGRGATVYQTMHIRQEVKTPSVMNPEL